MEMMILYQIFLVFKYIYKNYSKNVIKFNNKNNMIYINVINIYYIILKIVVILYRENNQRYYMN